MGADEVRDELLRTAAGRSDADAKLMARAAERIAIYRYQYSRAVAAATPLFQSGGRLAGLVPLGGDIVADGLRILGERLTDSMVAELKRGQR